MCFIKGSTNTCRSARKHTRASSYMSDFCLFLHSTAESCDTAKCALCTCPWNDHSQSESPWRNNLVKSKANKFAHHCQFPNLCVLEPHTGCFYFSHTFMLLHTQEPAFPFSSSASVKFYLIDFQQFGFVNPPSLSCLAHCVHVRPCCCQSQLRDGWMEERWQEEGQKK